MLQLRLIEDLDKDYEVVRPWWPAHGWPEVPKVCLNTMGLVAEVDGVPVMAGWVFTASTGQLAMLEWIVSNPSNTPMQSARALNALLEFAAEECKRRGYGVIFTTCRQQSLGRMYEKAGYTKTDEGVTHFIKILKES